MSKKRHTVDLLQEDFEDTLVISPRAKFIDVGKPMRERPIEIEVSLLREEEDTTIIAPRAKFIDVGKPMRERPVEVEIFPPIMATTNAGGGGFIMSVGETPDGFIDGVNKDYFTDYNFPGNSLWVYLNGLRQKSGLDYTIISGNNFSMTDAPLPGDMLTVDYIIMT
jgi:hypothetical protein